MKNINGQVLYGDDVMTIINNAIDNNEKNKVEKKSNGFYIENDINSVKVELTLLLLDEKEQIQEKVYQMESLQNAGLTGFISNFGLTTFECTNIDYNSNGKVKKIYLKQTEI